MNRDSSFGEHLFTLIFFSDSEKALFGFIEEIYDYDEEAVLMAFEIALEVLFDIHIEYITRNKYLTQTRFCSKKETLITMLSDSRWERFQFPCEREGVELGLSNYSFKLFKQILILGRYEKEREAVIVAMRLLYVLSVQKAHHTPVNVFRKIYSTEIKRYDKSVNFIYENSAEEIKGMIKFH